MGSYYFPNDKNTYENYQTKIKINKRGRFRKFLDYLRESTSAAIKHRNSIDELLRKL